MSVIRGFDSNKNKLATITNNTETNSAEFSYNGSVVRMNKIFTATKVRNAVFNDIADAITTDQDIEFEPGYAYAYDSSGFRKTEEEGDKYFIGIHSDTAGYILGADDESNQINIAIAGFVLAYVDKEYAPLTPLICTKNGLLTAASDEVMKNHSDRIIAHYFRKEEAIKWKDIVDVNGRHWVKIK